MEILEKANTKVIAKDLDMTNELREVAAIRMTSYQQRITNLYNRRVRQCAFRAEDLVLRRVFENTDDPATGKFQPKWEGPYVIVRVGAAESFALNKLNGSSVPKMWNVINIKRYYQ